MLFLFFYVIPIFSRVNQDPNAVWKLLQYVKVGFYRLFVVRWEMHSRLRPRTTIWVFMYVNRKGIDLFITT